MLTVSETEAPKKERIDLRLKSEKFRRSIRIVLDYLGLENNYGNFKKLDEKHDSETPVNWAEFADSIQHPTQMAVVKILDDKSRIMEGSTIKKLPGCTRAEAIKKLETKFYKFERWF